MVKVNIGEKVLIRLWVPTTNNLKPIIVIFPIDISQLGTASMQVQGRTEILSTRDYVSPYFTTTLKHNN